MDDGHYTGGGGERHAGHRQLPHLHHSVQGEIRPTDNHAGKREIHNGRRGRYAASYAYIMGGVGGGGVGKV